MNASNKMAIEVRKFIEGTLDWFSHDFSWLSNLRYELSVVCTHCQQRECDRHKKTNCDQEDCLHLLRVRPGEELICEKNLSDETDPAPGWEKWFEVPHSQSKEAKEDISEAMGTSSKPETTTQRVKGTKRKRNKNFTASEEEEYDVGEGEESNEEEIEEEVQQQEPTKKKEKKTGKGILIDLSEILVYYSTTAVVSSYTI
ncbi:PREDICTED: uncharacterized protein LOC107355254 [Acropora digitifera]|uniref:uncharacterized protein LOC107355254 n=1 Tax=Acropora digitifera TaxID=70779 RepID=UPI00077A8352|nr:PREDICTED: uncharacterized protein LOC107355254 [Acropora digitifera]